LAFVVVVAIAIFYTVFLGPPGSRGLLTQPDKPTALKSAPIESAELVIRESNPPQYLVRVTYGLRNGCIQPAGYEVQRFNRAIAVKVNVEEPTDLNAVCTQEYRTGTHEVDLGTDFQSGETYRVEVNTKPITFKAQ
jgi:hypothetical protein